MRSVKWWMKKLNLEYYATESYTYIPNYMLNKSIQ